MDYSARPAECRGGPLSGSALHRPDVVLVDRVRLAGVPLLFLVALSLAAPAVAGLSEAAAESVVEPALLMGDRRISGSLTGLRCLQLGGQQLGDGRQLLLSLRPSGSDDESEGVRGCAHGGRIAEATSPATWSTPRRTGSAGPRPQLYGDQPEHGFLRVAYAGALMVNGSPVVGAEPDRIVFDRFSDYRNKPGQIWGPPVWEFAPRGR